MDGYVSKPFTSDSLHAEITRVLDERSNAPLAAIACAPPARFGRALAGLEGDVDLFAEIAAVAVSEFDLAASSLAELSAKKDFEGLAARAHRLKSHWALYGPSSEEQLPDLLMAAASELDADKSIALAAQFSASLGATAQELRDWLLQRKQMEST
jgi:hypothetical protein